MYFSKSFFIQVFVFKNCIILNSFHREIWITFCLHILTYWSLIISRICWLKGVWNQIIFSFYPRSEHPLRLLPDFFSVGADHHTCIFLTIWFFFIIINFMLPDTKQRALSKLVGISQECLTLLPKELYVEKSSE